MQRFLWKEECVSNSAPLRVWTGRCSYFDPIGSRSRLTKRSPKHKHMSETLPTIKESFHEILQSRDLLYMLTWRDLKARYKQSVMGFFWAILMPLLIVGAGVVVRIAFSMSSGNRLNFTDLSSIALKSLP